MSSPSSHPGGAADLLKSIGRPDKAIALDEYARARDPLNPINHFNLGYSYLLAGRWDAAIAAYQTSLRLSPGFIGAHYGIGTALLFKGDAEAALAEFTLEEGYEEYRVKGQAVAQNKAGLSDQLLITFYTPIHSDPRWAAFLETVGSSPAQLGAIKFEVTLPK